MLAVFVGCDLEEEDSDQFYETRFTVKPQTSVTMTPNLQVGGVFEGYIEVEGGNRDLLFYMHDPAGSVVLDAGTVVGRYDYYYVAETEGQHRAFLNNSIEGAPDKSVYVRFRVTQP
jgi:hypothetical protein